MKRKRVFAPHFLPSLLFLFTLLAFFLQFSRENSVYNPAVSCEAEAAAYVLQPHERVVKTFAELKDALAADKNVTTVYLGADIVMENDGIKIHREKTEIVIDGLNPIDPTQIASYHLTDYASRLQKDTIYANSDNKVLASITVRNLDITGKNYYGPVSAYDTDTLKNMILSYENVTYSGPELGYHRQGLCRFVNVTAQIHAKNGSSPSSEFAEAKHIYFGGANHIDIATTDFSVFWMPGGGNFNLADYASLILNSPNTNVAFGVFYAGAVTYNIAITLGKHSAFNANIAYAFAPVAYGRISNMTLADDSSFQIKTTKTMPVTPLTLSGDMTLGDGSHFLLNSNGGSAAALLQRSGNITVGHYATFHLIASGTHSKLLELTGGSFHIRNPESVLLYNPNGRCINAVTSAAVLDIEAQQINYWKKAGDSSFENLPDYGWRKQSGDLFTLNGNLAIGSSGELSAIKSNYVSGDGSGKAPASDTFNLTSARVLSFGRLELEAAHISRDAPGITGYTKANALLRALWQEESATQTKDGQADAEGYFFIPLRIPDETDELELRACSDYRYAALFVQVLPAGVLEMTVPKQLSFKTTLMKAGLKIIERDAPYWHIAVFDTRSFGGNWKLTLRTLEPISAQNKTLPPLPYSILYRVKGQDDIIFGIGDTIAIAQRTTKEESVELVTWQEDEGLLLVTDPTYAFVDTIYTGSILWLLEDAP